MNPSINMDDLIWALQDNSGWSNYYLDLETGDIISMSTLELTEDEKDLDSDQYYYIDPMPWEAYNLMAFIETVNNDKIKRQLSIAIDGRGAFRMFKATFARIPRRAKKMVSIRQKNEKIR